LAIVQSILLALNTGQENKWCEKKE